jgi:hypothetical protein
MFCQQLGIALGLSLSSVETLALTLLHARQASETPGDPLMLVCSNLETKERVESIFSLTLLMTIRDGEVRRDDYSPK